MQTKTGRPDRKLFIVLIATLCIAAFAGFAPTYYLKAWFGTPPLKFWVHVHAALFTGWLTLLLLQSGLIRARQFATHEVIGRWALAIVVLMVLTGYVVILQKPRLTEASRAFIFTPLLSLGLFTIMIAAAVHFRRDAATHKRLMLLATVLLMGAPFLRLMAQAGIKPGPYTHHLLTYLLILVPIAVYDLRRTGRLHPATMWGGFVLILRHPLHETIAYTPAWQRFAAAITG